MKSRRFCREAALQALYQCDTLGDFSAACVSMFFTHFQARPEPEEGTDCGAVEGGHAEKCGTPTLDSDTFCEELVTGVVQHIDFLDAQIGLASTHWSIARMSRVDRNILRIATYELAFRSDVPSKVSLNEAIEIAKRFGADDSPMFVNGVLDHVASTFAQRPEIVQIELDHGSSKKVAHG